MPTVRVKGVKNAIEFPYDMDINDIKEVLQRKFTKQAVEGTQPVDLNPLQGQARATEQSLAEKAGQGISNALYDSGIISDRYGAQRIGENVTSIGEFLPGIGDATAGDEFGRALKQGDGAGMAIGALGAIPLAGDFIKKSFKGANPINMYDTTRNRLLRKESTVNLPQGNVGSDEFDRIKDLDPNAKVLGRNDDGTIKISYLEEYSPKQVNKDNDFLFEFEPDALEITEPDYKNIEVYRGDPNNPISVTKKDGDFFILDGHHRAKLAKDKGNNVKAVVIPFSDVESMKKDNIHPAEMFSEWVATGRNNTDKAMSVGDPKKGAKKAIDSPMFKVHNITEGGLAKADEFGGIPSPSIAIAGGDTGFDSFGEISLVGNKDSFLKDPTFASDVYSPRTPRAKDKIDYKAARAEEKRISGIVDPQIDSGFSSQFDPDRLAEDISRLEASTGNKAAFLSGIGEDINPSNYTSLPEKPKLTMDGYGFALRGKRIFPRDFREDSSHIEATKKWLTQFDKKGVDVSFWRDADGTPNNDALETTYKSMRKERQALEDYAEGPKFDRSKARSDIDKRVAENSESFNAYIKNQKSKLSTGQVFEKWNPNTGTSKKFDANLANAVKLMKGTIRGGEGFNYGVGSIRAQVTPQLKSLTQIQNRRGQIVGEDEMTMVKEGFDSRLDNLYDSLKGNWAYGSEPSYSDFADGVTSAAQGDFEDFKGLSASQKDEMSGFFTELANAPTNYFEVKPQRAVDINEFYGAAIPDGTSKSVIDGLEKQGLKIVKYKPDQRKKAIEALNKKSGGAIFFSGGGAAILYSGTKNDDEDNLK